MAAVENAIARVVAVASNGFKTKALLRHCQYLYYPELKKLVKQIGQSKDFEEVDGITLLRTMIFLGAVYLDKKGRSDLAEAALKGITPLIDKFKED